ncbi:hypothetical protein SSP531S_27030 [Streptomyces spongiicola]|uniref:Uncharacterized protein n=1 Tax=Streptomyces spongiicola TaxID=1690221 RepID=A0A388SZU1_9ACTN|nr:hypothetical protein SSP531S_27030 [Streptomyces spongiicola]
MGRPPEGRAARDERAVCRRPGTRTACLVTYLSARLPVCPTACLPACLPPMAPPGSPSALSAPGYPPGPRTPPADGPEVLRVRTPGEEQRPRRFDGTAGAAGAAGAGKRAGRVSDGRGKPDGTAGAGKRAGRDRAAVGATGGPPRRPLRRALRRAPAAAPSDRVTGPRERGARAVPPVHTLSPTMRPCAPVTATVHG